MQRGFGIHETGNTIEKYEIANFTPIKQQL